MFLLCNNDAAGIASVIRARGSSGMVFCLSIYWWMYTNVSTRIREFLYRFSLSLVTYREYGDHKKAIDIWRKETLPVYKGDLGDHPWTASTLRYMAGSYKALADGNSEPENVELALMYSRRALELQIKLLGVHQDTAHSHVDISEPLVIKKEFKEALDELEKALEIQREVLGEQHESTMNTRKKMVEIWSIVESNQLKSERAFPCGM